MSGVHIRLQPIRSLPILRRIAWQNTPNISNMMFVSKATQFGQAGQVDRDLVFYACVARQTLYMNYALVRSKLF